MDFASFKKVEGVCVRPKAGGRNGDGAIPILVKLRKGAALPSYVQPRAELGHGIFSMIADPDQITRLDADPAVESISPSKALSSASCR